MKININKHITMNKAQSASWRKKLTPKWLEKTKIFFSLFLLVIFLFGGADIANGAVLITNSGDIFIEQGSAGSNVINVSYDDNTINSSAKTETFEVTGIPLGIKSSFSQPSCALIIKCRTVFVVSSRDATTQGLYPIAIKLGNLGQTSFNLIIKQATSTTKTGVNATDKTGVNATGEVTIDTTRETFETVDGTSESSSDTYTFSVPNPLGVTSITDLIQRVINALIILSIPIASILIIYAGILYMTSAGTDRTKKATSALIWTIVGFGLLLISSGIISAIKNILGVKTIDCADTKSASIPECAGTTVPIVTGGPSTFQDILNIFIDLANKFFTFAIIIASVMIIVSGISFMTAKDDATKAATSRKILIYAIIGVAVAIASTFIIQIVKNYILS
ncbi:MAG: pilin [Patescibacteria group bacterium]